MLHTVRQMKQSHYPHPNTCSRPAEDLLINVTLWAMFSCAGERTAIDQVCFKKKEAAGGEKPVESWLRWGSWLCLPTPHCHVW